MVSSLSTHQYLSVTLLFEYSVQIQNIGDSRITYLLIKYIQPIAIITIGLL